MIGFFRNIRHKLLLENKLSKYIFYAVGEISLVVIGILIAFYLNDWNEERENKIIELNTLIDLQVEFEENLHVFNLHIEAKRSAKAGIDKYLDKVKSSKVTAQDVINLYADDEFGGPPLTLQMGYYIRY